MNAKFWRRCELKLSGCKSNPDYLIEHTNKKIRRVIACENCHTRLVGCKVGTTSIILDLRFLHKGLIS